MKLAIAQMVLGVIIAARHAVVIAYRFSWAGMPWTTDFVFLILGLAVLGCGLAQFLKAREARSKYEATP